MKIISYNVNGIRAAINKGFFEWLEKESPDVLCLQEIKAQEDQIDVVSLNSLGYNVYLHPAQKKGYSGVAILSKQEPIFVNIGMQEPIYDDEGRVLRADFGDVTVVCVYIPSGTMGDVRQDFKMEFLQSFYQYIQNLRKERTNIVVCGDYNICHKPIDINHPERHTKSSGFLPEERAWLDKFVESGMVDSYREFDQSAEKYTWWSYRAGAKPKNLGWRIDYHMVSESLKSRLKTAEIHPDILMSDHCPILLEID